MLITASASVVDQPDILPNSIQESELHAQLVAESNALVSAAIFLEINEQQEESNLELYPLDINVIQFVMSQMQIIEQPMEFAPKLLVIKMRKLIFIHFLYMLLFYIFLNLYFIWNKKNHTNIDLETDKTVQIIEVSAF